MKEQIARRTLLAAGPLALAACSRAEEAYFGNINPPTTQRLTMVLEGEPESLDPALAMGLIDSLILSLFEGLTTLHPSTGEAMAGLATHYEISGDGLRYTFYLRGHPQPTGTRLPNSRDLPAEYSRGRSAVSNAVPARWSDGRFITAHDFVYSWRRALEPSTGSMLAFLLYPVRNAREISAGKVDPSLLGIRATDERTLAVELEHLAPYFLELVSSRVSCAVPQHVIKSDGRGWTEPGRIVSSGPFRLRERRSFDSIVLDRNPFYYDAGQVALSELAFLIPRDPATVVNLYRSGVVTVGSCTIPTILPVLRRKRDFRPHRVYGADFMALNTATPPFDDVRVRYAFNMATDKRPVANLWGGGNVPASGMVPPSATYQGLQNLMISIEGKDYDVLSYNPHSARELLRRVNKPLSGRIECFTSHAPDSVLWAQVLKDQWRTNLGVEVDIVLADSPTWLQTVKNGTFRQVATSGSSGSFMDPVWFLDLFTSLDGYGTHWSDPRYNAMIEEAKSTADDALRRTRLLDCGRRLLTGMPVLPQSYWVDAELVKPFVRGLGANLLDRQQLKYVWIDMHWRPS